MFLRFFLGFFKKTKEKKDRVGKGRNTVSRVLFQKRVLTEFCGKLGEFCVKLGEFCVKLGEFDLALK